MVWNLRLLYVVALYDGGRNQRGGVQMNFLWTILKRLVIRAIEVAFAKLLDLF